METDLTLRLSPIQPNYFYIDVYHIMPSHFVLHLVYAKILVVIQGYSLGLKVSQRAVESLGTTAVVQLNAQQRADVSSLTNGGY